MNQTIIIRDCIIDQWIDELVKNGKLTQVQANEITRGDIGALNNAIIDSIKRGNFDAKIHYSDVNIMKQNRFHM